MPERRPIPGYPGYYADEEGRVWSSRFHRRTDPVRQLVGVPNARGYPRVCLRVDGRNVHRAVHCLVALAFLGPRPPGMEVNHKDGNKTNARPENLEYVTPEANDAHAQRMGLKAAGERNGLAKLTRAAVAAIRARSSEGTATSAQLAAEYGVHKSLINRVIAGVAWRAAPPPVSDPQGGRNE